MSIREHPRLRKYVRVNLTTGCWEWTGPRTGSYGCVSLEGAQTSAHRFSWMLTNGLVPSGAWVLHRCDNKTCVNPEHLFIGDPAVNSQDMARKLRAASKLTPEVVRTIRDASRLGLSQRQIAAIVGIGRGAVRRVLDGSAWSHIGDEEAGAT